jgi:hypothetical protein
MKKSLILFSLITFIFLLNGCDKNIETQIENTVITKNYKIEWKLRFWDPKVRNFVVNDIEIPYSRKYNLNEFLDKNVIIIGDLKEESNFYYCKEYFDSLAKGYQVALNPKCKKRDDKYMEYSKSMINYSIKLK